MSRAELKRLGMIIQRVAEGAAWECKWGDEWASPLGRDLEYCIARRIPIRLVESAFHGERNPDLTEWMQQAAVEIDFALGEAVKRNTGLEFGFFAGISINDIAGIIKSFAPKPEKTAREEGKKP